MQDVAWHCHHAGIFGSVGDDKQLILWDVRRPNSEGVFVHTTGEAPKGATDSQSRKYLPMLIPSLDE